jgi:uncharacterized damage-inducible protein DinB
MNIRTIDDFVTVWNLEATSTQRLFDQLTDASLSVPAYPGGRPIGRLAWHIAQTIPEMMAHTTLHVAGLGEHDPVPTSARDIADAYRVASESLVAQLRAHWTDATLAQTDNMYGEQWSRATTLAVLLSHQTHHRGQLTVMMRVAGLPVAGMYGPAKEEWASMGMSPPD